ncbi:MULTISPECIES: ABC transporter ATP-binding protein [Sphingobacterium]|jgi:phospholipid/cholesterol/gamma-HCH transport system ATP-binding protein|uniref:ATP-binding cassette domain-containing protein n=3 Tax=Sphingobacterium TaxID=28453 RepID=A0ABX7CMG0_SPHMU|nr:MULTISPECIES: ATP-binding cassette domain-containing protein [Sphingobacterium]MCS4167821.1 phospholipid/cholesterol/gamma-HCH transport system ATP-binding protein [Sphingobacterium sp. BIGb0116]QMV68597.1 ATP-binding cassette domain-containing protein [Sphingobacterium paramultivorum]QQT32144.1 ATP-binding cassette domain-containing protein [Sphingobacterium multivorum]QQT51936.1 ATP-binding cassette domain-containing protein [Sphingobacterium multivorum]QRY56991.1 ATP-binding cassette dom
MEKIKSTIDHSKPVIEIRDVSKSFGDNHVLRGVNLDLYKEENLVVLGRSGTGKSVLIKLISGLLRPDEGTINVLGESVLELNDRELRELRLKIGFSFQNSALYDSMTVRENLEFPLVRNKRNLTRSEINHAVEEVLDGVGLSQAINQMPSELSGGQRKRIGIARTLILRPEIMMYDEPTAGLDPITCLEINGLINEVQERYKTASIIITHDLACAKEVGDRIVMLLDGKFERQGSFEEIFDTDDARVRAFYNYNFIL